MESPLEIAAAKPESQSVAVISGWRDIEREASNGGACSPGPFICVYGGEEYPVCDSACTRHCATVYSNPGNRQVNGTGNTLHPHLVTQDVGRKWHSSSRAGTDLESLPSVESLKRSRRWIVRDAAAENGIRVASLASTYATGPSRCCEAEVYAMDYHDLLRFSPCYGEIVILVTIRGELNVEWYDN